MGSGKGEVDSYRARVKPGRVVCEISGVDKETAEEVMKQAAYKLPIKTKLVARGEVN